METSIPIGTAADLQMRASRRGEKTGELKMYYKIIDILKKNGHYSAVLTVHQLAAPQLLRTHQERTNGD